MTTDMTLDLGPACRAVTDLIAEVDDAQLTGTTPCAGLPVAGLLDHFMGLTLAFTLAARKSSPPTSEQTRPGPGATLDLDPGWRTRLPERLADLAQAWRDPSAWTGTASAGGVTMPAPVAAVVALDEVVLHGWDLARALGRPYAVDAASTQALLRFLTEAAAEGEGGMRDAIFGPVIEVGPDAPAFDRVLGLAGRDPNWTPAR